MVKDVARGTDKSHSKDAANDCLSIPCQCTTATISPASPKGKAGNNSLLDFMEYISSC